jgi:hypothetical protein
MTCRYACEALPAPGLHQRPNHPYLKDVYLIDMSHRRISYQTYLMSVRPIGLYLMGVYLIGVYLMGVHLTPQHHWACGH